VKWLVPRAAPQQPTCDPAKKLKVHLRAVRALPSGAGRCLEAAIEDSHEDFSDMWEYKYYTQRKSRGWMCQKFSLELYFTVANDWDDDLYVMFV